MTLLLTLLLWTLIACEAAPTPFPIDLTPEPTETPTPAALPPLRYGLLPNTVGLIPDLALLTASAEVIAITDPNDPLTDYDIVVGYGLQPDWTASQLMPHIAWAIHPARLPSDEIALWLRQSIDPQTIVTDLALPGAIAQPLPVIGSSELRTRLANAGYPDGIALTIGAIALPGVDQVIDQLRRSGVAVQAIPMTLTEIRTALAAETIDGAVIAWSIEVERNAWEALIGVDNVIDLYQVPISYRATPNLTIAFTPSGFPLISR
jgi:hypothetical protein